MTRPSVFYTGRDDGVLEAWDILYGQGTPLVSQKVYHLLYRRRIKTEEKENVVAAAWGMELIQFLAALAIFQQGDWKN